MGKMVFSVKRRKRICLLFWGIDKEKAIKLEFFAPFMRKYTLSGSPQRLRRSFFSTNHWKIFPVLLKTHPFPLSFDRLLKCINKKKLFTKYKKCCIIKMKIRRRETTGAFAAYGNVDSRDTLLKEKRNLMKREILCGSMKAGGVM